MGFALSAYVNDEPQITEKTEDYDDDLRPAIRFKKLDKCTQYRFYNYKEPGCDFFECEVNEGDEVNIYVNGELVYGPVKGGNTIGIV